MLILIILLVIAVVILIGLLVLACKQVEWERSYSADLSSQLDEALSNYKALEQGRDEETEAYQQELLTADEKIETYEQNNRELQHAVRKHWANCLPIYQNFVLTDKSDPADTPIFNELYDIVYA